MKRNSSAGSLAPDTARYYEAFAGTGLYDEDAERSGWPPVIAALMARTFNVKPADSVRSVLDLGAGTGLTLAGIKKHARPERLVAVDISPKMLKLLQEKEIAADVAVKADTIQNYAAECEEKFDLITSFSALEFLPNLPMTLRDIASLLNEDGAFAFTYAPHAEGEAPERLIDSTSSIGESIIEYKWLTSEIEQTLTDSGLTIVDRLDHVTPEVRGLDYSFIVAQKLPA